MKKYNFMTLVMCLALVFGSCSTKTGTGALIGTGGGALLGGIIGKIAGNTAVGAAIGSAVGAGAGAIIGKHMDKVAEEARQVQNAKVEEVTDANGLKAVKVTFDSGILFDTNKAILNTASKNSLSKFSQVMKNNSTCYVDVYGHTDSTGNDGINIPLSQNRAQSVVNYLESCGVPASQIQKIEGKGSSEPVADNSTKAGRQQNRRVEVYLYASQAMVDAANNGTLK
ncbi:MAG: OmpA family protein [Prevotella sp.]|jgi:outer membrane protein OmpA-like peptidoglycan-associated protein|nr:OmpA family protein [Prevotella sp.]MCI2079958.1 OmpA family protein [Prevotella sp.]MCI2101726.1 OmpA family protein [Prevotella sp.]